MNEHTPLRRSATDSPSDNDYQRGNVSQERRNGTRRRIRTMASLGLAAAILMYVGVLTLLPADQSTDASTTVGGDKSSSHVRASSTSSSTETLAPAGPTAAEMAAGIPVTASVSAVLPSPSSSSFPAAKESEQRNGEDGRSVKNTDLLVRPEASQANHAGHGRAKEEEDQVTFVPGFGAPLERQVRSPPLVSTLFPITQSLFAAATMLILPLHIVRRFGERERKSRGQTVLLVLRSAKRIHREWRDPAAALAQWWSGSVVDDRFVHGDGSLPHHSRGQIDPTPRIVDQPGSHVVL